MASFHGRNGLFWGGYHYFLIRVQPKLGGALSVQINSIIFFVQIKKFLIPDPNEFRLFPLTTGVHFADVFHSVVLFPAVYQAISKPKEFQIGVGCFEVRDLKIFNFKSFAQDLTLIKLAVGKGI